MTRLPRQQLDSLVKDNADFIPMFTEKLNEIQTNITAQQKQEDDFHTTMFDAEEKDMWVMPMAKDIFQTKIQTLTREKRKFQRLLDMASGTVREYEDSFDIPALKEIPIEELHNFEKPRSTSSRTTAICPFHEEKTPSFMIYHKTNSFYCFGSCAEGGDAIDFISKLHSTDFQGACKLLQEYA